MTEDSSSITLIDEIVDSYIDRQRRGERPTIEEYLDRYPTLAEEIRSIFPTLEMIEEVGSMPEFRLGLRDRGLTPVPTHLGEFKIVREIGRGGMGVVYEAIQESLGRRVALKVLPARTGRSPALEERFRREAQSAASLHHTNIVPLFSVGEIDGVLYYAMQFIEGESLDVVLAEVRRFRSVRHRSDETGDSTVRLSDAGRLLLTDSFEWTLDQRFTGPLTGETNAHSSSRPASLDASSSAALAKYFRNIAQLGTRVASALDYAHSRGIVHRDIKPSNLLLDPQGVIWVMDFGLAKAEGSDDLTRTGDVLGTVRYMAPEQLNGQADARTDVYALGLTLYEMVTLRPAFDEPLRYRLIEKIRRDEPTRPSLIEPKVPRDLETILLRAMAKDPCDRYPTAGALQDDLNAYLHDQPIAARRLSYWEHGVRWCRRNRMVASLVGVVVTLLLVASIASGWTALVLRRERNAANAARDEASKELWSSKVNQARAITASWEPNRRMQALSLVQRALDIADSSQVSQANLIEIRSVAASALLVPCVQEVRRWTPAKAQPDGWQQTVDFDENLQRFAVRLHGGGVSLRSVENDEVILVSPSLNQNPVVNMSPSGNFLAITDRVPAFERLEIWDIRQRPASLIHRALGKFGKFVAFSADDSNASYFRRDAGLEIVDLATRKMNSHATSSNDPWRPLAVDRIGMRLAYPDQSVNPAVVRIHDLRRNEEIGTIRIGDHVDGLAWHPSGRTLAVGRADESISLFDVDSREFITSFIGHTDRGICLAFNHCGDRLLSNDWENRLRVWDVGSRQEILSFPCQGRVFRIHPGDELVGTEGEIADGSLRVLQLEPGRALRTLQQPGGRRLRWNLTLVGGSLPLAWGTAIDAAADRRGLAAVSLKTGEVVAVANHPSDRVAAILEDGSVVSYGRAGIFRWPRLPSNDPEEFAFDAPIRLDAEATVLPPSLARDARIIAVPRGSGGATLLREGKAPVTLREGLEEIGSVAVDPEGTWIALANFRKPVRGGNICIVNANSCKRVAELEARLGSYVSFSPDGRWLMAQMVTSTSHCRIWRVGRWNEPIDVDGLAVTIDSTGTLAASSDSRGCVRLFRLDDLQDIVRLSLPGEESLFVKGFSADGSVLLVGSAKHESARLIDLGMLRRELANLGLDWDTPSIPPSRSSDVRVRWPEDPHP